MTLGGWLFMLSSLAFVVALAAWCYWKVLTAPPDDEPPTG